MSNPSINGSQIKKLIYSASVDTGVKTSQIRSSLCETLGITRQCLNNWIQEKNNPTTNHVIGLCKFFKVDLLNLIN